ncbi:MAG: EamA family transporter, partial [Candidatus Dadabacteria bacterium]|nr:EamA family transporter [Candidatus Dadabacteria bacterium]NIS09460.1 EamA family transporter [Candidatus Dadabacteria bacterium]NIV42812.1 EamA family transporter [Candidatus Dadabacteria bacterium]NIY22710.1 EamA family transporter [Candidatus Dadabacteria bacterium]
MNLSRRKKAGYTSAVISTVLLGSVGIFVRNIHVDEFIITLCRLGIGLLFVIIYLLITGNLTNISIKRFTLPLISTGVLLGLTMLFYMKAISTISLANSVFLLYLGPIIAAGISFLVYKERFTYLNLILISTAFIGFMFLLQFSFDIADNTGSILGLSAGLCYAFYIVINRRISDAVDSM